MTDGLSGVATLQEQVDSGPFVPVAVDSGGGFAVATALPLNGTADGMHTVHLRAVDAAGNASDAFATFGLDTTGPSITVSSPGPNATVHDSPVVVGQVQDNLAGLATLFAQVDSGAFQAVAVDSSGNVSVPTGLPADGSADGPHTVHFRATDRAGNVADASTTFTLTTTLVNRAVTTDPGVQQMPSIAVDPLDANHLVLAYMDRSLVTTGYAGIGVAVSHDAGATLAVHERAAAGGVRSGSGQPDREVRRPGARLRQFHGGATFLGPQAPLTNRQLRPSGGVPGIQSNNGIFVARSDDGGLTWNQPVAVVSHMYTGQPVDFEITPDLAIDTFRTLPDGSPNPRYGELYATWTRVYAPGHFPGQPDSTGGADILISRLEGRRSDLATPAPDVAGVGARGLVAPGSRAEPG